MKLLYKKQLKKIFSDHGARFAYLFGSRAGGKGFISSSDFDIAVFLGSGTQESRFAKRLRLLQKIQELYAPQRVDLLVLDDVRSVTLRYSVITEGKVIYDTDPASRINFEFRALLEYEEFLPFLKDYNKMYIKTGT